MHSAFAVKTSRSVSAVLLSTERADKTLGEPCTSQPILVELRPSPSGLPVRTHVLSILACERLQKDSCDNFRGARVSGRFSWIQLSAVHLPSLRNCGHLHAKSTSRANEKILLHNGILPSLLPLLCLLHF